MASMMDARRRILTSSPRIESISGNLASFKTDIKAPLKSVKAYFSPIQSGTGNPSPTNVRPISGHDGITLTHTGVNLLRCATFVNGSSRAVTFTGTRNSDGEIESISVVGTANAQNLFRNLNYVNGEYRWPPYGNRIATFAYCDDIDVILAGPDTGLPNDIYGVNARAYLGRTWRVFDLVQDWPSSNGEWFRLQGVPYQSSGVAYNSIARPMACIYDDAGCEFEPYKGSDTIVSWQTEAGTLYGGYIDLVSGRLVEEWAMIASYNGETLNGQWISDRDVYAVGRTPTTGAQVLYKLSSPVVHALTPQTIKTLKGRNNIWSSVKENIEVEYWTR